MPGHLVAAPGSGMRPIGRVWCRVGLDIGLKMSSTYNNTDVGCGGSKTPTRDGIVTGTSGNDFMDGSYVDKDGDRPDNYDAILPGAAPQDDLIKAGDGNDTVIAGEGNDKVYAGNGNDYVDGGVGNDTVYGECGNDTVWGREGQDLIYGGEGADLLKGGAGNDTVYGGAGNDVIYGGDLGPIPEDGADALDGGDGNDTIYGGTSNDTITGGNGRDSVEGGDGNDLIDTSGGAIDNRCGPDGVPLPDRGYPGLYPADSDPYNDRDTVFGGAGNDTIRTGDDNDLVHGGAGNDSIDGGFDDDTIFGDEGNDIIIGAEGSDSISGGDGDDVIYGGYGPGVPDAVNIRDDQGDLRPDNGKDTIDGGAGNDTIYGMDDADSITGGAGNDSLDGGIDNDVLDGGDGDDIVLGGQGSDTLTGGNGADRMYGGDDNDMFFATAGDTVDGGSGGNDYDTLDLTGGIPPGGHVELINVTNDADGNSISGTAVYYDAGGAETGRVEFSEIERCIPCFTPGSLIATPRGEVPVESLKVGDKVITRDNGIQEIRWLGQKDLSWANLLALPHLKPVLIKQGSLGNGLPERDMLVSPNHRMLVANDRTQLYFDEHEVLVSAKHLVSGNSIHQVDRAGVSYIHFMFDAHQIVLADGAWTESFQPGDYTLKGIGNAQRSEIVELFPELATEGGLLDYVAARRTLKRHEARLLAR